MMLYTPDEISEIFNAFTDFKVNDKDQREQMDYLASVQGVAHIMKEFLDAHTKPKPRTFFGLFGAEEE